jgi:hypothetical protein
MNGNRGPIVWIVYNDSRKNFKPAEKFGKLRDIFTNLPSKYPGEAMLSYARETLIDWQEQDYLLMVGDPTLCALCAMVVYEVGNPGDTINLLRWRRDTFEYEPIAFNFN